MDKKCVVIDVNLAVILGVSESIIVQQMIYWLEKSTHIIEGRPWIFNSYASWQKQLPFFCESTIRRLIKKLEDMEIILSGNFNKSKMDKTKWYSINYDALNKLQEKFDAEQNVDKKHKDDDIADNCILKIVTDNDNLHCDNNEQMKRTFEEKNCSNLAVDETSFTKPIPEITPETNLKDVVVEVESSPLIANCKIDNTDKTVKSDKDNGRSIEGKLTNFDAIIKFFSSNIHLPTPHECEKLRLLYEDIKSPGLIIKAMEIAVENRVRTFRYIESILYNWIDLNLHNLSEVQEYMQNYKETVKTQSTHLKTTDWTFGIGKERKDDSHGEKKYPKWGDRQYSGYNKKTQGEVQGKYSGFKPEEPKLPEFTEEDFAEFR